METLRKTVALMEKKHRLSSDDFMRTTEHHLSVVGAEDAQAWSEACTALKAWTTRKQEYEAIYRSFKI
jgi:hypothetical protein